MTSDYMAQEGSEGPGRQRPAGSFLSGDQGLVVVQEAWRTGAGPVGGGGRRRCCR